MSIIPFPLLPLLEQKRIVAEEDELMCLCNELETRLRGCNRVSEELAETVVNQVTKDGLE